MSSAQMIELAVPIFVVLIGLLVAAISFFSVVVAIVIIYTSSYFRRATGDK